MQARSSGEESMGGRSKGSTGSCCDDNHQEERKDSNLLVVGGVSLNFASLAKDAGIKGNRSKKKLKNTE